MTCACTTTSNELPGSWNVSVYRGATFNLNLTWTDGNNAPVNLTGYTADMVIAQGQNRLIELSTSNGRIALGGTAGTINLNISATDTAQLPQCNASYDLLLRSGGGVVYPLLAGLATVRGGVTGGI